jgi:hypothetical protein
MRKTITAGAPQPAIAGAQPTRQKAPDLLLALGRSDKWGIAAPKPQYVGLSGELGFSFSSTKGNTQIPMVRYSTDELVDGLDCMRWAKAAVSVGRISPDRSSSAVSRDGPSPGQSSAVEAVVDAYGPTNFARIDAARAAATTTGTDAESNPIGSVLPAADPDSFESDSSAFLFKPHRGRWN